jgi:hypothetical protein
MRGPRTYAAQGGGLVRWCGRAGPAHVRIGTLTEGSGAGFLSLQRVLRFPCSRHIHTIQQTTKGYVHYMHTLPSHRVPPKVVVGYHILTSEKVSNRKMPKIT